MGFFWRFNCWVWGSRLRLISLFLFFFVVDINECLSISVSCFVG